MNNEVFEMAIKETYKDIFLTRKFINTNLDIKNKLMKKYKRLALIHSNNDLSGICTFVQQNC